MTAFRRTAAAGLAVLLAAAAVPARQPAGSPAPPAVKALDAVPRDGFLVASVDVAKLWDHPQLAAARDWFATQKDLPVESAVGVAPAEIERVTVFLPTVPHNRGPAVSVLVTTRRPYNEARVVKHLLGDAAQPKRFPAEPFGRQGNTLILPGRSGFDAAVMADDRTLVFLVGASDNGFLTLLGQLLARRADGPLAPALAAAPGAAVSVGLDPRALAGMFDAPAYAALLKASSATLTADLAADGLKTRLALTFPDAADAGRAGPVLEEGIADLGRHADAGAKQAATRGDRGALEAAVFGAGRDLLRGAKVEVKGVTVVAAADGPGAEAIGKLAAALPRQVAVARKNAEAQNNLKQILLGLHSMHDAYGFFPGDVGPDRKTAWSWRVQVLPFIEQDALFRQLDFQQPWDAPRNKAILEKAEMPKVFEVPGRTAPKGHTYWRSFTLPKKADPREGEPWLREGEVGPKIAGITDGTSNTIAVVEAGEAVPWYAPDVLAYDGVRPLPPLGEKGGGGFLAGMGDGSVRFVRAGIDEKTLRAAITRNGNEVATLPDR
jgi:hypothetical protein